MTWDRKAAWAACRMERWRPISDVERTRFNTMGMLGLEEKIRPDVSSAQIGLVIQFQASSCAAGRTIEDAVCYGFVMALQVRAALLRRKDSQGGKGKAGSSGPCRWRQRTPRDGAESGMCNVRQMVGARRAAALLSAPGRHGSSRSALVCSSSI